MNAIVLAGGKAEGMKGGAGYRAGLVVGGRTLLAQVLRALSGLPELGQVVLVGQATLLPAEQRPMFTTILLPTDDICT
ncbi:MAG: NTP transferase domain-containing protein, partial [Firmicutes bacterium]|nr:NTP transferase domain-containing protein [Bacillota bacterium]